MSQSAENHCQLHSQVRCKEKWIISGSFSGQFSVTDVSFACLRGHNSEST